MTVASEPGRVPKQTHRQRLDSYLAWNETLCAITFTPDMAGIPVYLDMDDDVIVKVGERLGVPGEQAATDLISCVRSTLDLTAEGSVFGWHLARLRQWRLRNMMQAADVDLPPPPVVALLALFTMAAEAMGGDDAYKSDRQLMFSGAVG